jgi:hypothetical protein
LPAVTSPRASTGRSKVRQAERLEIADRVDFHELAQRPQLELGVASDPRRRYCARDALVTILV